MNSEGPVFRRILLKLSGEALAGGGGTIDPQVVESIAQELREVTAAGVQVAIVIGGGNLIRGAHLPSFDRAVADQMGMLATVINGLALQNRLDRAGLETRVMSAVPITSFCEPFIRRRCLRHLNLGRVVILVAGTGNPFFTTDTAAALRASEIQADCLIKATKVDGVFDADPEKVPGAKRLDALTYDRVIEDSLAVMDTSAIVLCKENEIPILVFKLMEQGNLIRACAGETVGTRITS